MMHGQQNVKIHDFIVCNFNTFIFFTLVDLFVKNYIREGREWLDLFTLGSFISFWRRTNIEGAWVSKRLRQRMSRCFLLCVVVFWGSNIGSDTSFRFLKPFQANTVLSETKLRSLRATFFTSLLTNYFSFRPNVIGNTDGIVKYFINKW